jgi:hypothetical protein
MTDNSNRTCQTDWLLVSSVNPMHRVLTPCVAQVRCMHICS